MIALFVTIRIKLAAKDAFLQATKANHEGTRQEPGNQRFDVLADSEDPAVFYLYEVYDDQAAIDAHRASAHYAAWRDAVADLMDGDRSRVLAEVVHPTPWA